MKSSEQTADQRRSSGEKSETRAKIIERLLDEQSAEKQRTEMKQREKEQNETKRDETNFSQIFLKIKIQIVGMFDALKVADLIRQRGEELLRSSTCRVDIHYRSTSRMNQYAPSEEREREKSSFPPFPLSLSACRRDCLISALDVFE